MLYSKFSKESSLSNKSQVESLTYNTNDHLNPNSVIKEEKDDLLKLLGQGPKESQEKRNSLLQNNLAFNNNNLINTNNHSNITLNVAEYQRKIESESFEENKKQSFLNEKIKEEKENEISFSREKSNILSQRQLSNDSKLNKSDLLAKRIISDKTFSDKNSNLSKNTKKNFETSSKEEKENFITDNNLNSSNRIKLSNLNNNDNADEKSFTTNSIVKVNSNENNQQSKTNILNLEKGELNSNTLHVGPNPASPQNLYVPDYNQNNEEIKEEINELLNLREIEKLKLSKRRKSINIRRKSVNEKKRNLEINSAAIVSMINKDNENSQQVRFKKYIKYIDILIAITVCFNIAISIIDNEIYISKSDAYLREYMNSNNITGI